MAALAFIIFVLLATSAQSFVVPQQEQFALLEESSPVPNNSYVSPIQDRKIPRNIAIIGSGITGAVTAFQLAEGFRSHAPPDQRPSITIFERNPIIGGRITQAFAYNDSRYPIDTCAATFALQDSCLASTAGQVGLGVIRQQPTRAGAKVGVGVWDGEGFVGFVEEDGFRQPNTWSFYRKLKWFMRYGNEPWRLQQEAQRARLAFMKLLPSTLRPGSQQLGPGKPNLAAEIDNSNLQNIVQNFICSNDKAALPNDKRGNLFARDVMLPGERERFFENVDDLNVLEYLLGYEAANPISIQGGNLRLIDRLLRLSTFDIRLRSEVRQIKRDGDSIELTVNIPNSIDPSIELFDVVVIATSLDLANITIEPALHDLPGLIQDYKDSFVTHFTTTRLLNPDYFNRTGTMPQRVLTTTTENDLVGVKARFFSLTLLRQILTPEQQRAEYLFKLVSRHSIPDEEIAQYLIPDNEGKRPEISWIDRQTLPRSVPFFDSEEGCREILGDIEIAPGIFYAGGGEQVVASAEMGCRMGGNVAGLIVVGKQR